MVCGNKLPVSGNGRAATVRCTDKNQLEWIINYDITSTRHPMGPKSSGKSHGCWETRDEGPVLRRYACTLSLAMGFSFKLGNCWSRWNVLFSHWIEHSIPLQCETTFGLPQVRFELCGFSEDSRTRLDNYFITDKEERMKRDH